MPRAIYKGTVISGSKEFYLMRKNSQSYEAKDIALSDSLPSSLVLECTVPGTTASSEPSFTGATEGSTVTDGTVVWTYRGLLSVIEEPDPVTIPTATDLSLSYTGSSQGPTLTYDNTKVTIVGTYQATEIGNYSFKFYLSNPHATWSDGTSAPIQIDWSIGRATISNVPTQSGTLTYDGTSQSPTWSNYDSDTMSISGTITGINAGSYTAVFTPKANYQWGDADGTDGKSITWSINKASGSLSLSSNSISLDNSKTSNTITVTRAGNGTISAVSSDTSIATVSLSGTTLTITAVANGSTTIVVSVAEGSNHLAPSNSSISVSCSLGPVVSSILNENSWDVIAQVAQLGTGDTYWDIGDVKMVTLNGKIGDYFTASNLSLGVFILDFNHKMDGSNENNIIFGGFKTAVSNGTDVCLCDSGYGSSKTSGKYFNMNHNSQNSSSSQAGYRGTNYGGWKGTDLRYDILGATSTQPSMYNQRKTSSNVGYDATATTLSSPVANTFMSAIPSDLRSVIRLWTRYLDAVGGGTGDTSSNIKATIDAVTLLAEPEIFSSRSYANNYEFSHNTRMSYYTNGNSAVKYQQNSTSTAAYWWESSAACNYARYFCLVGTDGSAHYGIAFNSLGLAPAFKV